MFESEVPSIPRDTSYAQSGQTIGASYISGLSSTRASKSGGAYILRLLALDPGATTGWATFIKGVPGERYHSGQVSQDKVWDLLESAKFMTGADEDMGVPFDLKIICESFQHRQLPKVDLSPVEVIGVVKEWARQNNVEIIWQTAAQGKAFWDNNRLATLDLLRKPQTTWRHANDAMRHILWYLGFGKGVRIGEAENIMPKKGVVPDRDRP